MSDFVIPEKNKRTIQDIIFAHLERILEMCKQEFTGGHYNTVVSGNITKTEYVGDKKEEYCQLVESLSDILTPKFDKTMQEEYKSYEEDLKDAFDKHHNKEGIPLSNENYAIYSKLRLKLTRKLFRSLNLLLARINYAKASVYTYSDKQNEMELDSEDIIDIDPDK